MFGCMLLLPRHCVTCTRAAKCCARCLPCVPLACGGEGLQWMHLGCVCCHMEAPGSMCDTDKPLQCCAACLPVSQFIEIGGDLDATVGGRINHAPRFGSLWFASAARQAWFERKPAVAWDCFGACSVTHAKCRLWCLACVLRGGERIEPRRCMRMVSTACGGGQGLQRMHVRCV